MILVDTGPLIGLFDPKDGQHRRCVKILKVVREPIRTTVPVLTEAFHMLGPASVGSDRLREFVLKGGLSVWWFDAPTLARAFELMDVYSSGDARIGHRIEVKGLLIRGSPDRVNVTSIRTMAEVCRN